MTNQKNTKKDNILRSKNQKISDTNAKSQKNQSDEGSKDKVDSYYPQDEDILSPKDRLGGKNSDHSKESYNRSYSTVFMQKMGLNHNNTIHNHPLIRVLSWLFIDFPNSRFKKAIIPLFCGWLVSLGFQPKNHTFLALIGLLGFYRHCEKTFLHTIQSRLQNESSLQTKINTFWPIFFSGYWFGFSYFLGGLYWVVYALHIDWAQFIALIPLVLIGIPGILAIGMGAVTFFTFKIARFSVSPRVGLLNTNSSFSLTRLVALGAFCFLWSLWDFSRGHVLTGFPWLILSEIWLFGDTMIQTLSLMGSYGLGFITLILFACLYVTIFFEGKYRKQSLSLFMGIGGLCLIYGHWYIQSDSAQVHDDSEIIMVQPNIRQTEKWDPQKLSENVEILVNLSKQSQLSPSISSRQENRPKLFIWPEASVPFVVESGSKIAKYITHYLRPDDLLIIGYNRLEDKNAEINNSNHKKDQKLSATEYKTNDHQFNSLAVLNHRGEIIKTYDKAHLVPFGEYLPFRNILPSFINSLAPGAGDFSVGSGLQTLDLKGFPLFSPLICYEAIFANEVIQKGDMNNDHRPQWLLNITNDGWYLGSAGIYQHLHITRMRSIEEGIPLVRVNYRGVSAVFNARGRLIAEIPFDQAGTKMINLPKTNTKPTVYARYGESIYFIFMILLFFIIFGIIVRIKYK